MQLTTSGTFLSVDFFQSLIFFILPKPKSSTVGEREGWSDFQLQPNSQLILSIPLFLAGIWKQVISHSNTRNLLHNCQATPSLLAAIPCYRLQLSLAIPGYSCCYPLLSFAAIPCNPWLSFAAIPCSYPSPADGLGLTQLDAFPFSGDSLSRSLFQACSFVIFLPLYVYNHTAMWPRLHQSWIFWSSCSFASFCTLGFKCDISVSSVQFQCSGQQFCICCCVFVFLCCKSYVAHRP